MDNSDKTTEDFLNGINSSDEFFDHSSKDESIIPSNDIKDSATLISSAIEMESTDTAPDLVGTDYPEDYIKIVNRVKAQYNLLPNLNYDKIYQEIIFKCRVR